jgi:hypothetical protein
MRNQIIRITNAENNGLNINMKFNDDMSKRPFFRKSNITKFRDTIFENGLIKKKSVAGLSNILVLIRKYKNGEGTLLENLD